LPELSALELFDCLCLDLLDEPFLFLGHHLLPAVHLLGIKDPDLAINKAGLVLLEIPKEPAEPKLIPRRVKHKLLAVFGADDEEVVAVSLLFSNLTDWEEDSFWVDIGGCPCALLKVWVV
jgi:hypothetical protein